MDTCSHNQLTFFQNWPWPDLFETLSHFPLPHTTRTQSSWRRQPNRRMSCSFFPTCVLSRSLVISSMKLFALSRGVSKHCRDFRQNLNFLVCTFPSIKVSVQWQKKQKYQIKQSHLQTFKQQQQTQYTAFSSSSWKRPAVNQPTDIQISQSGIFSTEHIVKVKEQSCYGSFR